MDPLLLQIVVGVFIGLIAGYIGSFMVLRRMALVGDALSHVALPGIAAALFWQINPFVGAFVALFLAIIAIWLLENRTELPSETLVGIFFTISLAIGLLLTPEPELLEALFGDITQIGITDLWITVISTIVILIILRMITKKMMVGILSKELAQSMGIGINKINLAFLFMVAAVVALGLKIAGTLLMGSLVIIPAAAAKNVSSHLGKYTVLSSLFGALSAGVGIYIADYLSINPGPIVVLAGGVIFLFTLVFKK